MSAHSKQVKISWLGFIASICLTVCVKTFDSSSICGINSLYMESNFLKARSPGFHNSCSKDEAADVV